MRARAKGETTPNNRLSLSAHHHNQNCLTLDFVIVVVDAVEMVMNASTKPMDEEEHKGGGGAAPPPPGRSIGRGWSSPFAIAIVTLLSYALVYEPVRQQVAHGQSVVDVGGVGGVGGLANLSGPPKEGQEAYVHCPPGYQDKYCYTDGWLGPVTPLQAVTLAWWVGPLVVASAYYSLSAGCTLSESGSCSPASYKYKGVETGSSLGWLPPAWTLLNLVWFLLPFASFGLGLKSIEAGVGMRMILAIALAASHPLSWNLSLVVIPTSGVLSKLIVDDANGKVDGSASKHWFDFHRVVGYSTAFWAVVHGSCELVYLLSSKKRFHDMLWNIANDGEVVLYWLGVLLILLIGGQACLAYLRRSGLFKNPATFARVHRRVAVAILLAAAAHWWPFALFFLPATTVHGMSLAGIYAVTGNSAEGPPLVAVAHIFGFSLIGQVFFGFLPVWTWREAYMRSKDANLYMTFIFPPLSVLLCLVIAMATTFCYVKLLLPHLWKQQKVVISSKETPASEDTPLLGQA